MPWYAILALICVVIGPFDALYMYIKAGRRKEKMKEEEKRNSERFSRVETGIENGELKIENGGTNPSDLTD